MTARLVPCPTCSRHIRLGERNCPFCTGELTDVQFVEATTVPTGRLSRATLFALSATLAVTGASACAAYGVPPPVDVGTQDAFFDSASDTGLIDGALEGGADVQGSDAQGGDVTEDAAVDAGSPDDDGGGGARYGAPPPPDAG